MALLKTLFIVTLLIFPLGEIARFQLPNNISLSLLDIAVALTALIGICHPERSPEERRTQSKDPILLFISISILSLLINSSWLTPPQLFSSSLYLIRWLAYAGIFFALKPLDHKFKKTLLVFFIIDGAIILLCGYLQYFLYSSLKSLMYLGWDEHMYRMFSTFLDPNFAGTFFVLYFILTGGLAHQYLQKKKHKIGYSLVAISILSLIAIFLTFSRGALVMFATSTITYLILINKKKLILIVLAIIITAVLIISPFFYIENLNLFRTFSSKERLQDEFNALQIIQKNPILGVGFNAYRYAQIKYHFRNPQTQYQSHADASTDNSFLFIVATTGLPGLLAYLYLWKNLLYHSHSKIFLASTTGLFINSLFINALFFPSIMLWMWMMYGIEEK
jgi:O-antigen ligase